jgi:hypothetical protein
MHKRDDIYFILVSDRSSTGSSIPCLATKPQMLSELWHQCLGHPIPTQLSLLAQNSAGLPSKTTAGLHPMHSCQAYNDGIIKRSPMCDTSDTVNHLHGTRFHLDFFLIRTLDVGITAGHGIVTSYDGKHTFLIIVYSKAIHTWVFYKPSKYPPIHILKRFLEVNGLKDGPRFMRMDQGGELWRSKLLRDVASKAGYTIETTGSDAGNENGKVECTNGTFGAMLR